MRIIFMGTPDFAVGALEAIIKNNFNVVAVVTTPDRPVGRGRKMKASAVKEYALEKGITVLQPEKLKAPDFIEQLKSFKPDLQIVVAFRMLPEVVWSIPPKGTLNLHASLLPQYRGAAPINRVIMNGEKETGVTTFFIEHNIDTGAVIASKKVIIKEDETAGSLHDKLMKTGSELLVETIKEICMGRGKGKPQNELIKQGEELKTAAKIFKDDCKINWTESAEKIYNHIRGLSPYPAAWTELKRDDDKISGLKIFETEKIISDRAGAEIGEIISDGKKQMKIAVKDGFIALKTVQLAGKKRMPIADFLRGIEIKKMKIIL